MKRTSAQVTWMWVGVGFCAILVWLAVMAAHGHAAEEAQPKWKIVVTLDGPPGKQELTYGKDQVIHWFKDKDECEAARKGGDKDFAKAMKQVGELQATLKKQHVPIEVTVECRMDNSV